jgi:hypothetical protein
MTEALQSSEGLCISHLQLALGSVNDESAFETLLAIQRRKWENLKTELAEFIRKSDYHVIQQGFGSEGNAWLRAISLIAGNPKER